MAYDFKNLLLVDFEDLVRDLIGREFGVRFEAFAVGPDGGIDGRHSKGPSTIILPAKHFSKVYLFIAQVPNEARAGIHFQAHPCRYVLATSCPITALNKSELIGPSLKSEADIFGPDDLNGLLRKYPDIANPISSFGCRMRPSWIASSGRPLTPSTRSPKKRLKRRCECNAIAKVNYRIAKLDEETEVSDSPSFNSGKSKGNDVFDDAALKNLFMPLVQS